MKLINLPTLAVLIALPLSASLRAQDQPQENPVPTPAQAEPPEQESPEPQQAAPGEPDNAAAAEATAPDAGAVPPAAPGELRLNFRNARLEQVLNYLSTAAGFTIVPQAEIKGTLDVWSNRPVTVEEALSILDSALAKNGLAAIRNGKQLTIVSKAAAAKLGVPIIQSADWQTIPTSEVVATYIIPVRYINATELITTLQPLTPDSMQLTANADSNSLLVTDTQAAIRRIAHIASLLDSSVSSVTTMKIIPLKHSDAKTMADTINELYSNSGNGNSNGGARNNRNRNFNRGNFFPFGGGRGGPGPNN